MAQTISKYCETILQTADFNRKQQLIELVNKFLLDWNNIQCFKILIDDGNPTTTFVLYELLQKLIQANTQFLNVPNVNVRIASRNLFEDFEKQKLSVYESQEKVRLTEFTTTHIEIAMSYIQRQLPHPLYVQTSALFAIAYMIRRYWSEIMNIDELVDRLLQCLMTPALATVGCRFFENLLSCIRQYHYSSGYLEFRKVMIGFQRQSLQKILQGTYQQIKGQQFSAIVVKQKLYGESLIQLIFQLLTFNFNLSFYELDLDNDVKENNIVNFPDCYFPVVSDPAVIQSFYQAAIEFYPHDLKIANQFIYMLQRIACCRLSIFLGKKCKKHFRRALWEGLLLLLQQSSQYNRNQEFMNEVCSLALRIINNLTLRKLQKFKDIYDQVVIQLSQLFCQVLQNSGFKIQYLNICIKLQEVWNQLLYQMQLQKPFQDQSLAQIQQFIQQNFQQLIQVIIQGDCFSEMDASISVKKFKKIVDNNFSPFHTVYQSRQNDYLRNFADYLLQLKPVFMNYPQLSEIEQLNLLQRTAALLSLISSFVLYNNAADLNTGFDYYSVYQREERPSNEVQSRLIQLVLEFISMSSQLLIPANNAISKIFHMTTIVFIENYIGMTIDAITYDEQLGLVKSTSALSQQLIKDGQSLNFLMILEKLLEKCFHIFTLAEPALVEQSLKLIESIYSKVKRQLPRRVFRESSLSIMLRQFFAQLEITCFNQPAFIKKRKLIFKIIAIVWVDDQMDDYIPALVEIYKQIKNSISQETTKLNMLKYLWDLIGVCEEIDVDIIYRIFLRIIFPDLAQILNPTTVQIFAQDFDSSIGLLTLLKTIFFNKNMRLSNENIQLILYQIYGKAMHFFIILSDHLLSIKPSEIQLQQASRLFRVMNEVTQSKQINQGFFLIYGDTLFLELFIKQLQLVKQFRPFLKDYPKYRKSAYDFFDSICVDQSETLTYRCSVEQFLTILEIAHDTLKDVLNTSQAKGEEQINEEASLISQVSNVLLNVNSFIIQEALIGHSNDTAMIKQKIADIIIRGKEMYTAIFEMSFSILNAYPKVQKIQSVIPDIFFVISLFSPVDVIINISQFQALLIQLIQQTQAQIGAIVLEQIGEAYKHLETQIHPQSQVQYVKKIKAVLEQYK